MSQSILIILLLDMPPSIHKFIFALFESLFIAFSKKTLEKLRSNIINLLFILGILKKFVFSYSSVLARPKVNLFFLSDNAI